MKGYKIEGIGSIKTKFISCSNEVNCFFVVISYVCANVTTIILNGTCKNLSACQLRSPQKIPRVIPQRKYVPLFPSAHKCVYVFTFIICLFFFCEGKDCISVQRI